MEEREISIMFWNLNGKDLSEELSDLVNEYLVDILIVAEAQNLDNKLMLNKLESNSIDFYDANIISNSDRIFFYTSFDPIYLKPIYEDEADRISIRKLTLPLSEELIIGGVHLLDQRNYSIESRQAYAQDLKIQIEDIETINSNSNTIIIGDFNMNPFEKGMYQANGLHAVSNVEISKRMKRKILSKEYTFFYNPSWSLLGDLYNNPAGSYYYNKPGYDSYYWNVFDQVILRPQLINKFSNESYKIISEFNGKSLLSKSGLPNRIEYSDHLPIYFKLENL